MSLATMIPRADLNNNSAPTGTPTAAIFNRTQTRRPSVIACKEELPWIKVSELKLRLVEAPQQEQSPNFKIARMRGIQTVIVLFERYPRRVERLCREAEVARGQCDLGLGHDTHSSGHGFLRTEGPRSAPQQFLRSPVLAELRHRDASKREHWRIISQGDSLQRSDRITRCERTC